MALTQPLRLLCAATACAVAAPAAAAGVLFGVVQSKAEAAEGLVLAMRCPTFDAVPARGAGTSTVADQGSYTLYATLNARGRCPIRAERGSRIVPPLDILVNDGWSRYNLRAGADLKLVVR